MSADRPPGLALERTTMAWIRTTLGLTVVALLFLRFRSGGLVVVVPTLAGVGVAWAIGLVQWQRHPARLRRLALGSVRFEQRAAACTTALVVVLALAGLLLVLTGE